MVAAGDFGTVGIGDARQVAGEIVAIPDGVPVRIRILGQGLEGILLASAGVGARAVLRRHALCQGVVTVPQAQESQLFMAT
jgi:hypothetical protein